MKKALLTTCALAALTAALALPAPATAAEPGCEPTPPAFGLCGLDVNFADSEGQPEMLAGSHPFAFATDLSVNVEDSPEFGEIPVGQARNLRIELPAGLAAAPTATPRCEAADFATLRQVTSGLSLPSCSDSSVVGLATVRGAQPTNVQLNLRAPVYNLVPPPGAVAKFGFVVLGAAPVTFTAGIEESPPYKPFVSVRNIPQMTRFYSSKTVIWGNPSSPAHDTERGKCGAFFEEPPFIKAELGGECPTSNPDVPFLTLPSSCGGPLQTDFDATSWLGDHFTQSVFTHGLFGEPLGVLDCGGVGFSPETSSRPTTRSAESASGLAFDLTVKDAGIKSPVGRADSTLKRAEVSLPEGMTLNPSQAEGLGVCSEADFARETAASPFGAGCPGDSKVGTVEVESPLLEGEIFKGNLFVAEPFKNPFGSLIALYMTVKDPALGIGLKFPGQVSADPRTGRIVTVFDDLPEIAHVSRIRVRLREGARSPLITPARCGTYNTEAKLTPWANPAHPIVSSSSFEIDSGVGGGACPPAGTQPFQPGLEAGTLNNNAGSFSPFSMRLTRRDGDQDLTKLSATLPRGLVAKLAGLSRCSETRIDAAKTKTGLAELASPSCPASSEIGHVLAGAGVGSQLTYVGGKIYLAGPYNGAPLSVVEIVPAVAGPFDVGTVVVRQALVIDPRTAEVRVDGDRSDPIPHILAGIPLRVRDIRAYVDRPGFTLNPTGCDPAAIGARLWGGGADVFSALDDSPVSREARFQAAGCASLGFKPKLSLKLKGGTKRGAHPALTGTYTPRAGDANLAGLVLRFPRAAFLDQAHIRTICTRVQFAAKACPPGAVYGRATAYTPLLDEPLSGPVYLRSSDHNLPDFVADLHGLIDVEAVARIDSKQGGIRATFSEVPDAPLTKVVVQMQGARKGLIVNSTDLCRGAHRATAQFSAHNGKSAQIKPGLRPSGCKAKPRQRSHRRR
jgi:hypothetical protein